MRLPSGHAAGRSGRPLIVVDFVRPGCAKAPCRRTTDSPRDLRGEAAVPIEYRRSRRYVSLNFNYQSERLDCLSAFLRAMDVDASHTRALSAVQSRPIRNVLPPRGARGDLRSWLTELRRSAGPFAGGLKAFPTSARPA